ncbi:pyruvate dehydrogenase (acetyl-transferring), homodimeric type [Candidatus Poriferisocius sp.]|uniref:pyruvate dehydrogenase (acetyl-transferring), homodimeric type n=1 Tax=Candidatus Poriferisocius sp. TaxID=3101276 RepID=UPI003B01A8FE
MAVNFSHQLPDTDPEETREWLDSLDAVFSASGGQRSRYLLRQLLDRADELGTGLSGTVQTPYVNTIPTADQPFFPGDENIERRIRAFIRWNAAVMVVKANKRADGIGGHLSTFASSAALYEVGFNHFFRGKEDGLPGDAIYIQGHAAPGIYARAYLEGRLTEDQLDNFRMEIGGSGLSSYPHPRLMPDFWEYPSVSMGLGPINSIYHARFYRYLHDRRIEDTSESKVWCFVGDGECDEPETLGSISLAGRAKLGNLIWVVNCNLQRLDGPVRGNGKIIQELEGNFRGSGWNVIKVIWGSRWDELLAADVDGVLLEKMMTTVDGEYQRYATETGAYIRENFFGPDPRLRKMVDHLSDRQLEDLPRGGHDYLKLYAAYKAAVEATDRPTVILAKTIKGWTLGEGLEARNATHQVKKMTTAQLMDLRSRLHLEEEIPAEALEDDANPPYYKPPPDSPEHQYLMARRKELDGPLPTRVVNIRRPIKLPDDKLFADYDEGSDGREVSTTMVFTQMLRNMMRDEEFGARVVPIVPDEARTFGMDSLFREFKIYASEGQLYEPVDHDLLLSYAEGQDGQLLEEGITEAGSLASWTAAATSYATMGVPMVPFYSFYSMFGFQRVGDLIWSAADSRARGFLMGATAGRTTLLGEGLQHQDGHSHLLASTVPACCAYDPAFAYELGAIVRSGLHRMYGNGGGEDVFYYITIYNENYRQPRRADFISDEHILSGLYQWNHALEGTEQQATIIFSGTAHQAARDAQAELAEHYGIGVDLLSAPSFKAAREEALEVERWNRLHPDEEPRVPMVTQRLAEGQGPVVAVTDYMTLVPDQIARWVPRRFIPLGTDGFGRSDTRESLRRFFETDAHSVVSTVLSALAAEGSLDPSVAKDAITRYDLLNPHFDPTG